MKHVCDKEKRWQKYKLMLDAFCVSGEYDEIADRFVERYGGLLDEVSFTVYSENPPEEGQMRKMVRRLQEL